MEIIDYTAWRCTSRDKFPEGESVFCPIEGCSKKDGCYLDNLAKRLKK